MHAQAANLYALTPVVMCFWPFWHAYHKTTAHGHPLSAYGPEHQKLNGVELFMNTQADLMLCYGE